MRAEAMKWRKKEVCISTSLPHPGRTHGRKSRGLLLPEIWVYWSTWGIPRCATNFKCMFFKKRGLGLPGGLMIKNPPANAEDMGSTTGLGKFHIQRSNWACASQLLSLCSRVLEPQLPKPVCLVLAHHNWRVDPACCN